MVLTAGSVFFFGSRGQKEIIHKNAILDLEKRSKLFRELISEDLLQDPVALQSLSKEMGDLVKTRFTVILSSGEVLSDSHKDPNSMDNHRNRSEIVMAFKGQVGSSYRYSSTLKKKLFYVAIPLKHGERVVAVVRSSNALEDLGAQILETRTRRILVFILILFISGTLLWFWARKTLVPIARLKSYIEDLAGGNLKAQFETKGNTPKELSSVAAALSKIVREFRSSQKEVIKGQLQQEVILENMEEGVISVSESGKVNHINLSAQEILGITLNSEGELSVRELIRLPVLRRFIEKALLHKEKREREIVIDEGEVSERIFTVRSSPIFSFKSKYRGSIFVLVDVSELRKLERHRQDFVSNVSHELKTPLTSIKGYAETMQNPSLSQKHLREFSNVIQKHADHLDLLIDDLLTLSKLESGTQVLEGQPIDLETLITEVMDVCSIKAKERDIQIKVRSSKGLKVKGSLVLLTQALINLVDNAIKYSPEKTVVTISSSFCEEEGFVELKVKDQGPGIPESQQARLFERFYRVDGGRSRDRGGTGLGLSIVRHIMYAHGGEAGVQSTPGHGSQFYLRIPVL